MNGGLLRASRAAELKYSTCNGPLVEGGEGCLLFHPTLMHISTFTLL